MRRRIGRLARWTVFLRFCCVGAVGFAVDASALLFLLEAAALGPIVARTGSIALALTATWGLHRRFTFASRDEARVAEWSRFALVNGVGGAINFAVYSGLLLLWPGLPPLSALAAGSAVALAANYAGSRRFAFRALPARPAKASLPACP